ncbi:HAMP domain-containing sensor histidine kinase [uncultured Flavobacterium sp.]|uniref:sensor histidine kinase n=1 Tax=uncultured Flavobacterium sp. TaxID=165435 RepID=UPI0025FDE7E1|nr:HAMP domain-containing sensor histidine kinase [uncultured Flavobacterium sp.]
MKRKIYFLIAGCIITVGALAPIQGYFIYNTYRLYAKEANAKITQELLRLETDGKLDTINSVWMARTQQFMKDYAEGKVKSTEYERAMRGLSDSLSGEVQQCIASDSMLADYDVTYTNYVTSARVCKDTTQPADTIFKGKMLLYGTNVENIPEEKASQSTWRDNTTHNDSLSGSFEVVTTRYYSIADWEKQVFARMSGLLIFSVLLLVFVVVLFYLSIKNLIAQKKIADIKTDFINNITHEFQTPLGAMDIAVKMLGRKDGELTKEQFGHSISIIDRQNKRMQKLFGQVKEASLTNGIDTAYAQPVTCPEIHEMVNDFALSHPETKIECPENDVVLHMDKFHLATLLGNLLDNAVKYGANAVLVTVSGNEKNTVLVVADNGMGIPIKEQKLIFDKFYRVEKGNIHTAKGLGLGLFYVKEIINAYKGSIAVASEKGSGSAFTITLPRA